MRNRTTLTALSLTTLSAALLVGCGASRSPEAGASASPESPAAASKAAPSGAMADDMGDYEEGASESDSEPAVESTADSVDGEAAAPSPAPMVATGSTGSGASKPTARKASGPSADRKVKRAGKSPGTRERRRPPAPIAQSGVRAGEWDDNANYREFQRFLSTQDGLRFQKLDVSKRRFIAVRDRLGKGVPGCSVRISDKQQHTVTLTTTTSGRAILFPIAEGLSGKELVATTNCASSRASKRIDLSSDDGVVDLQLKKNRSLPKRRTVDIAFVLDTTGSMSEEIAAVKQTINKVAKELDRGNVDVRIALVDFKDRSDGQVTRVHNFSRDLPGFGRRISRIQASGGGDTPEDVNQGLNVALTRLSWNKQSVGRFAFLVGDAPPHLDYKNDVGYAKSAKRAARKGIQLFTIAASGMDGLGQVVWRQLAQYTGGTNMFVLRGGAGSQSTGAGDAKSSCGGTHKNYASGNLDALIVAKVRRELKALDGNPLRIAGLGMDENAKPCHERLVMAQ